MNVEEKKIAVSTHFIMLGLNVFCGLTAWQFSSKGIFATKGMTLSGNPAKASLILFILCVLVCNIVYIIGLFKQSRQSK